MTRVRRIGAGIAAGAAAAGAVLATPWVIRHVATPTWLMIVHVLDTILP